MRNADVTPAAQHRFFVLVVQVVVGNTHPVHQGAYRQQFAPTLGTAEPLISDIEAGDNVMPVRSAASLSVMFHSPMRAPAS